MKVVGNSSLSPLVHLVLDDQEGAATWPPGSSPAQLIRAIADEALHRGGLLVCPSQHSPLDLFNTQPTLR